MEFSQLIYLICISFCICNANLFEREEWTQDFQLNLPVCKLIKLDNVAGEVHCGKECTENYDYYCVYFNYDFKTKICYLCTTGNISKTTNFEYLSHLTERNFPYIYWKVNMCKPVGSCVPKDCSDYRTQGYHTSGVYTISPSPGQSFEVYCDMETAGGGWTVFQRRMDGSEDFYKTWNEYESGFGNMSHEFWLGNANISAITSQKTYDLRIDFSDFDWTNLYVIYDDFNVNKNDYYRMNYKLYKQGNAGDSLYFTKGTRFSAKDRDLDTWSTNCATKYKGAWWYSACHASNLNGLYLSGTYSTFAIGVVWYTFHGHYYSLRLTEMKLRPSQYTPPYELNALEKDLPPPKDCADHRDRGVSTNGIYSVTTRGRKPSTFDVYCDMTTTGGGWTVFQRRTDGSQDFLKNWNEYQNGFGNLSNEFWLGNDKIADFTDQGSYELRVNLEDFDGIKKFAVYDFFTINRQNKYRLLVGSYSGDAGDSMARQNGSVWSTPGSDNSGHNCVAKYKGAWWYSDCHHSNLNGPYLRGAHSTFADSVNWYAFRGHYYSLKFTEMKIRPAAYAAPP